jgi:hypothetical protein
MKRIFKRAFTHDKKRYLLTLDTDGIQLYLRCYEGSSENNMLVSLEERQIREKVFSVIQKETDSSLAVNALREPERISNRVRMMNNIPYPSMPEWDAIIEQLQETGSVEYQGSMNQFLLYLEYRRQPVVHFKHKGKMTLVDARPDSEHVHNVISKLNQEMKELKLVIENIYDQKDIIERMAKDGIYEL